MPSFYLQNLHHLKEVYLFVQNRSAAQIHEDVQLAVELNFPLMRDLQEWIEGSSKLDILLCLRYALANYMAYENDAFLPEQYLAFISDDLNSLRSILMDEQVNVIPPSFATEMLLEAETNESVPKCVRNAFMQAFGDKHPEFKCPLLQKLLDDVGLAEQQLRAQNNEPNNQQ